MEASSIFLLHRHRSGRRHRSRRLCFRRRRAGRRAERARLVPLPHEIPWCVASKHSAAARRRRHRRRHSRRRVDDGAARRDLAEPPRPRTEISRTNTTRHAHYTKYYDDYTLALTAKAFSRDIDLLGYEFGA